MQSFLSYKRSVSFPQGNNITKRAEATFPAELKCDGCRIASSDANKGTQEFPDKYCICVDSRNYAFFTFGEGLTIEGADKDGKKFGTSTNAWGGSSGYFKISTTKPTEVTYFFQAIYVNDFDIPTAEYEDRQIFVAKDWEGTIKFVADIEKMDPPTGKYQKETVYVGAKKVTLTYETEADVSVSVDPEPEGEINTKKGTVSGSLIKASPYIKDFGNGKEGKFEAEAKLNIKINEKPKFYPDIIFQLKQNQIFDDNLEEYEFLSEEGLSAGAIAGIVIACVVVVGVVVFCIVWFVVLKKSCPCKGGSKDQQEP